MPKQIDEVSRLLTKIRCSETALSLPMILEQATENDASPIEFLRMILTHELTKRDEKSIERRMKQAAFPYQRPLSEFQLAEQPSLSQKNFNKLSSLIWIEQTYNLVFLGPTGTGKTSLSVGLGIKAVLEGYRVTFVTMGEMVHLLKTMEFTTRSLNRIKRIKQSDVVILDDLMFMAMDKSEANLFFHFINDIYETTSIILTSNKSPADWGQLIGDEIITGAILDRIIQRSEIIQLSGESYRLRHREGLFDSTET